MRHVVSASLVVLLASSVAHATVYVWKDREGSLVLTNDAGQVHEAPNGLLITYETTESAAAAPAAKDRVAVVAPQPVEAARAAAPATAAAAPAPAAGAQSSVAGAAGKAAPAAPLTPAAGPAGPAGSAAPAPAAAPRTLGEANAQHLIAAATTPTTRGAVDPRALLDVAARAEPPQVIVRIVEPSSGPLSTSDGANSLAGGGMRAARGDLQ